MDHQRFAAGPCGAAPLAAIETALGTASLEAGDADAAARLWSLSWPGALDRTAEWIGKEGLMAA